MFSARRSRTSRFYRSVVAGAVFLRCPVLEARDANKLTKLVWKASSVTEEGAEPTSSQVLIPYWLVVIRPLRFIQTQKFLVTFRHKTCTWFQTGPELRSPGCICVLLHPFIWKWRGWLYLYRYIKPLWVWMRRQGPRNRLAEPDSPEVETQRRMLLTWMSAGLSTAWWRGTGDQTEAAKVLLDSDYTYNNSAS